MRQAGGLCGIPADPGKNMIQVEVLLEICGNVWHYNIRGAVVMKKAKRIAILVLVAIIVIMVAVLYIKMGNSFGTVTKVGGGITFEEILDIGQLSTLEYRYRDIIDITEEKQFKLFGLNSDPREHLLIVQYEGIMKLGIDCEKIQIGALRCREWQEADRNNASAC